MKKFILCVVVLFALHTSVLANVEISGINYGTITAAVAAAVNGDLIMVSTGTYAEAVDVFSKNITIEGNYNEDCSAHIPSGTTIIDASTQPIPQSVFYASGAIITLKDLWFTGGDGLTFNHGGGMDIRGGAIITAVNCRVIGNISKGFGGGIYAQDSELHFLSSSIISNQALNGSSFTGTVYGTGGGIYLRDSNCRLTDTPVEYNFSVTLGGGLTIDKGSMAIITGSSSDIASNIASNGGGIAVRDASVLRFGGGADMYANLAIANGGAIFMDTGSTGLLTDAGTYIGLRSYGNPNTAASGNGGGVYVQNSRLTVANNARVAHNSADMYGGGLYVDGGELYINAAHLTSASSASTNYANKGGGLYATGDSTVVITNGATIQRARSRDDGGALFVDSSTLHLGAVKIGDANTNRINIAGADGGAVYGVDSVIELNGTEILNNVAEDDGGGFALFACELTGSDALIAGNAALKSGSGYGGGIYGRNRSAVRLIGCELLGNSASRDGGAIFWNSLSNLMVLAGSIIETNTAEGSGGAIDLYTSGSVDIRDSQILYNMAAGDGGAIHAANGRVSVIHSQIDYNSADSDNDTVGDGGGICGVSGSDIDLVSIDSATTLTGNTAYDGGGLAAKGSANVKLDAPWGIIQVSGNAATNNGGAIHLSGESRLDAVGMCMFVLNRADEGGAIYATNNVSVSVIATNPGQYSSFFWNGARGNGGAICVYGTDTVATLMGAQVGLGEGMGNTALNNGSGGGITIQNGAYLDARNCMINGNYADRNGGGLYMSASRGRIASDPLPDASYVLPRTLIEENSATNSGWGGGIEVTHGSELEMDNVFVYSNRAALGGGLHLQASTATIVNVVIAHNSASSEGDGIRPYNSDTHLRHCTIVNNGNHGIWSGGIGALTLTNCIVYGQAIAQLKAGANVEYCDIQGGYIGTGNINADPLFADTTNLDFRLTIDSPCTNGTYAGITNDCRGIPRPLNGTYDMGAYEYDPAIADSDKDTMTDGWEDDHGLNPRDPADALVDSDLDWFINKDEFTADTHPFNSNDFLHITILSNLLMETLVGFDSSSNRQYTLEYLDDLASIDDWKYVEGQVWQWGNGGIKTMTDTNIIIQRQYRVIVDLPY